MAHFAGSSPTPDPSPFSKGENGEWSQGTSIAVLQFVALMRGEWAVQAERSPFRVGRVFAEERYCLGCYGVRVHDVVEGVRLPGVRCQVAICRCCGCTGEVCEL